MSILKFVLSVHQVTTLKTLQDKCVVLLKLKTVLKKKLSFSLKCALFAKTPSLLRSLANVVIIMDFVLIIVGLKLVHIVVMDLLPFVMEASLVRCKNQWINLTSIIP